MNPAPERPRWYNSSIPPGFPAWLVACIAVGGIAAFAFSYGLDQWTWGVLAVSFGFGFGFSLLIFTMLYSRRSRAKDVTEAELQSGFYPPFWVRHPVFVALIVAIGVGMVDRQKITIGRRSQTTIAEGPVVAVIGFVVMLAPSYWCVQLLRQKPGTWTERATGVVGMLIVSAGVAYAVYRIATAFFL